MSKSLAVLPSWQGKMVEFDLSGGRQREVVHADNGYTVVVPIVNKDGNIKLLNRHKTKHNVVRLEE